MTESTKKVSLITLIASLTGKAQEDVSATVAIKTTEQGVSTVTGDGFSVQTADLVVNVDGDIEITAPNGTFLVEGGKATVAPTAEPAGETIAEQTQAGDPVAARDPQSSPAYADQSQYM